MKNWHTYAIIALFIMVIFLFITTNKTMKLQTSLLVSMADKLGLKPLDSDKTLEKELSEHEQTNEVEETQQEREVREESEEKVLVEEMVRISDKIKANIMCFKGEADYYTENFDDMHEDLQLANPSGIIVDISEKEEKEEDGEEEDIKKLSLEEKYEIILSFFTDNTPKQLQPIIGAFSKLSGLPPNKGNTHSLLQKMVKLKMLDIFKKKGVFYILPEWKEGNKLKKEYVKNMA